MCLKTIWGSGNEQLKKSEKIRDNRGFPPSSIYGLDQGYGCLKHHEFLGALTWVVVQPGPAI